MYYPNRQMKFTVEDLGVAIANRYIFRHIFFEAEDHQMVAITGPSGCGKTTLLSTIGFLRPGTEGRILLNDCTTEKWKQRDIEKFWHRYSAFLYQDSGIIDDENVLYNVTLTHQKKSPVRAVQALKQVGLEKRERDPGIVLSGGEKRRLGIARLIYKEAKIIYADEPTASLDRENRKVIAELLRKLADKGAIVFLATHDAELVEQCDKKICLGGCTSGEGS